jgi:light-regulated signal transduction histidine kinase (bacteriophytochrome)
VSFHFDPESLEERARVRHDLKSHLTLILGYADLLRTRDDETLRREAPARIIEAAERLSLGLDELFDEPAEPLLAQGARDQPA